MMRSLNFDHSISEGLHRFVYAPGECLVVQRHSWPVLTTDWSNGHDAPSLRFAVNDNNTEEVAVQSSDTKNR